MLQGYAVIDADCHVFEPADLWSRYLEPEFQSYAPTADLMIGSEPICRHFSPALQAESLKLHWQKNPLALLAQFDPESHVRFAKQQGIDLAFLYPTIGLWLFAIDRLPPAATGALVRAYNRWLADFCQYDPQILRGVGAINLHDPTEMIPELHRIAALGWTAVTVRPNPVQGRLLSDPAYDPFWAECERLEIAVGIHEGAHSRLPTVGADRFHTRLALHTCSHPMEQMLAIVTLIEGGVLERFPRLRVAFLEGGCSWLPYWLWRLDEAYHQLQWEVADRVKLKPSDYFRRQCFISVDPREPGLAAVVDFVGSENLLFGSDYPHMDYNPHLLQAAIALQDQLPEKTVRKLLWDNPARFYRLK